MSTTSRRLVGLGILVLASAVSAPFVFGDATNMPIVPVVLIALLGLGIWFFAPRRD